jgi:hypothetical protein
MLACMNDSRLAKTVLFFAFILAAGCSNKDAPPSAKGSAKATTSAASIPTTPVDGKLGGQAFTLKKVTIVTAKGFGEWRVTLEGTRGGETAAIRFPVRAALGPGKTVEASAAGITPGGKPISVNVQRATDSTTSSNASYRLEIARWDVKPCPADSAPTHEGGHASGRLFVRVPSEDVEIAGTFEDALVSYGATPDWEYR